MVVIFQASRLCDLFTCKCLPLGVGDLILNVEMFFQDHCNGKVVAPLRAALSVTMLRNMKLVLDCIIVSL